MFVFIVCCRNYITGCNPLDDLASKLRGGNSHTLYNFFCTVLKIYFGQHGVFPLALSGQVCNSKVTFLYWSNNDFFDWMIPNDTGVELQEWGRFHASL
jgi:hypothetical protein